MESESQRSRLSNMSKTSSMLRRKVAGAEGYKNEDVIPITEEEEFNLGKIFKLVDKDGKTIELTAE